MRIIWNIKHDCRYLPIPIKSLYSFADRIFVAKVFYSKTFCDDNLIGIIKTAVYIPRFNWIVEKLKEIYSIAPNVNQTKASVMAAFGIADELFKLRTDQEKMNKMIEEKTEILSGFLD